MNRKLLTNLSLSAFILGIGVIGLKIFGQKPEVPKEDQSVEAEAARVVTSEVVDWDQTITLSVDGEAATYRIVTIGSEVEGRVIEKSSSARSGTYVRAGEVLFRIDQSRYKLELKRLKAQLAQVTEELDAIGVDLQNTNELIVLAEEDVALQQRQLRRMKQLDDRNAANPVEVDEALKQELMARNSLKTLQNQKRTLTQQKKTQEATVDLVEAEIGRAKLDFKRCEVKSTLDGRIVDDIVEEGDYLKSGDDLVHISDGSRMEIKCQLQGSELAWIWRQHLLEQADDNTSEEASDRDVDPLNLPNVSCEVVFEFEGVTTIWNGKLSRLEGTGMDTETRMFPIRVLVDSPSVSRTGDTDGGISRVQIPGLLSGLFVTVKIPVKSPHDLLKLPLESVRPGGQVWQLEDNQLREVRVTPVHVEGNMALIDARVSSLKHGDRVVISPLPSAYDGMKAEETSAAKASE